MSILKENQNNHIFYLRLKKETLRKSFHILLGISLLLFYFLFGKFYSIIFYSLLLFLAILSDLIRIRVYISYPLKKLADIIARSYERSFIGAHTYYLAGILVTLLLFESNIFIISVIIATIIDPIISLAGLLFNKPKHPYNPEKSVIGTLTGCIILFIISYLFLNNIPITFLVVLTLYLLDSLPLPVNDNILYPPVFAFIIKSLISLW